MIQIKTRRRDRADARGRAGRRPHAARRCAAAVAPGVTTARARRARRGDDPRRGRASRRSWATTASRAVDLRVGERRDRARHPGDRGAARGRHHLASTAARSSTAGTATRRSPSPVGEVDPELRELLRVSEEAMWRGIAAATRRRPARRHRRTPSRAYVRVRRALRHRRGVRGHGIGTEMHQEPHVPNYGRPGPRPRSCSRAWRSRSSRCSPSGGRHTRCSTTTGPSSPPTAAVRRTSSTPFALTERRPVGAHRPRRRRRAAGSARRRARRPSADRHEPRARRRRCGRATPTATRSPSGCARPTPRAGSRSRSSSERLDAACAARTMGELGAHRDLPTPAGSPGPATRPRWPPGVPTRWSAPTGPRALRTWPKK